MNPSVYTLSTGTRSESPLHLNRTLTSSKCCKFELCIPYLQEQEVKNLFSFNVQRKDRKKKRKKEKNLENCKVLQVPSVYTLSTRTRRKNPFHF